MFLRSGLPSKEMQGETLRVLPLSPFGRPYFDTSSLLPESSYLPPSTEWNPDDRTSSFLPEKLIFRSLDLSDCSHGQWSICQLMNHSPLICAPCVDRAPGRRLHTISTTTTSHAEGGFGPDKTETRVPSVPEFAVLLPLCEWVLEVRRSPTWERRSSSWRLRRVSLSAEKSGGSSASAHSVYSGSLGRGGERDGLGKSELTSK